MSPNNSEFDINSIRIAKPCSVPWESTTGDERIRRCGECKMNIYNTAAMNADEVRKLVENPKERLCLRLYRRADGTLMTADCPRGIRALRKRAARYAGAALAALLGAFSIGYGQDRSSAPLNIDIQRTAVQERESAMSGTVTDMLGAAIPGARVQLRGASKKITRETVTDENGVFRFSKLPFGTYELEITSTNFKKTIVKVAVKTSEDVTLNVGLEVAAETITVGIFFESSFINMSESGVTTTITSDMIRRIPN